MDLAQGQDSVHGKYEIVEVREGRRRTTPRPCPPHIAPLAGAQQRGAAEAKRATNDP